MDGVVRMEGELVTVFGSTGTGKTKLSVELAVALRAEAGRFGAYTSGEVISCDSMQIYKDSAQVRCENMGGSLYFYPKSEQYVCENVDY